MIERGSLRARLLLGAGLWIALALAATGLVLSGLFRAHVTWQYDAELAGTLDQLAALAVLDADGLRLSAEPAGPRFHRPYGGRYWQIDVPGGMTLLGRSNWWFPRWLDRIVPNFSIEGDEWFRARDAAATAPPVPAPEPTPTTLA